MEQRGKITEVEHESDEVVLYHVLVDDNTTGVMKVSKKAHEHFIKYRGEMIGKKIVWDVETKVVCVVD